MIINQCGGSENLKTELTQQDTLLLQLNQILDAKNFAVASVSEIDLEDTGSSPETGTDN